MKPAKHIFTLLKQVMETIPPYLVGKPARVHGVDRKYRSFSAWSHVASMVLAQLSHALSLNGVCDTLRHPVEALGTISNDTAPSRNGLPMRTGFAMLQWGEICFNGHLAIFQSRSQMSYASGCAAISAPLRCCEIRKFPRCCCRQKALQSAQRG